MPLQLGLCAKALANSRGNPLSRQWLFSAYVHRPPGAHPLQSLHAFYGNEVAGAAQVRELQEERQSGTCLLGSCLLGACL